MPSVVTLLSPVGGIGKSTLSLHLAQQLAGWGKRTLLIDVSGSAPVLDIMLGVDESMIYSLTDVAKGLCSLSHALLSPASLPLLSLLPAAVGDEPDDGMLALALKEARGCSEFDYMIVDAAKEIYTTVRACSDQVILLTDPRPSSLRASEAYASFAEDVDSFILTYASFSREGVEREDSIVDIADQLSLPLLGVLPYAPMLRTLSGIPRSSPYAVALDNVTRRIMGERIPLLKKVPLEGMSRRYYIERRGKNKL